MGVYLISAPKDILVNRCLTSFYKNCVEYNNLQSDIQKFEIHVIIKKLLAKKNYIYQKHLNGLSFSLKLICCFQR